MCRYRISGVFWNGICYASSTILQALYKIPIFSLGTSFSFKSSAMFCMAGKKIKSPLFLSPFFNGGIAFLSDMQVSLLLLTVVTVFYLIFICLSLFFCLFLLLKELFRYMRLSCCMSDVVNFNLTYLTTKRYWFSCAS